MALTKYTQADFAALGRAEDGYIHVPAGDWSSVDFGSADGLHIAAGSILGDKCKLGDECVLGDRCRLGNWCRLGDWCVLGNGCTLGDGCSMEGGRVQNAAYFIVTNIGSRNRSAYAYCNTATGDIYVRAGCWFGGLDDFVERVHEVHAGTQYETDYIAFVEFARARFGRYKNDTHQDI